MRRQRYRVIGSADSGLWKCPQRDGACFAMLDRMAKIASTSSPRFALIGLSLGYFMVLFDTTALTVALPDVTRDLHSGVVGLAWITDAYTLTFAAFLLAAGVIADRQGSGRTFLSGLMGFGALSLLCAAAPSTGTLVALRALLGVSGSLVLPPSLALIAGLYTDPARRPRAVAAWASISGVALAAGPLLGGVLVAWLGWRGIFFVNAPVAALSWLLLRGRMPVIARRARRIDARGQVAILVAVTALTWALIRGGAQGWTAPDVLAAFALTVVAGLLVVLAERRSPVPAVPGSLLKVPVVSGALIGGFVAGGAFAGELFLTTLQLQQARGFGVILTGAAFLPLTAPMVLNPPLAGRLIARTGPALPVFGGLLLVTVGSGVLAAVRNNAPYAWVAVGLVLLGLGMSFTLPALTSAVVLAAPAEAAGAASGLFSVLRQTGATVGVAAMAAVIGAHVADAQHGHILIAVAALAAAVTWRMIARPQTTGHPVEAGPRHPTATTRSQ